MQLTQVETQIQLEAQALQIIQQETQIHQGVQDLQTQQDLQIIQLGQETQVELQPSKQIQQLDSMKNNSKQNLIIQIHLSQLRLQPQFQTQQIQVEIQIH